MKIATFDTPAIKAHLKKMTILIIAYKLPHVISYKAHEYFYTMHWTSFLKMMNPVELFLSFSMNNKLWDIIMKPFIRVHVVVYKEMNIFTISCIYLFISNAFLLFEESQIRMCNNAISLPSNDKRLRFFAP